MACAIQIKAVFVIFNTIFMLMGLGICSGGLLFRLKTNIFQDKPKEVFKKLKVDVFGGTDIYELTHSLALLIIIVGVFIFLVGALGCYGAIFKKKKALVMYSIIVILLLLAQTGGIPISATTKSSFDQTLIKSFKLELNRTYGKSECYEDAKKSFNAVFEDFECCGVDSAADIPQENLPTECCAQNTGPCTKTSDTLHKGCYTKLESVYAKYTSTFIGVGVTTLVFQASCIICAFCLCAEIKITAT